MQKGIVYDRCNDHEEAPKQDAVMATRREMDRIECEIAVLLPETVVIHVRGAGSPASERCRNSYLRQQAYVVSTVQPPLWRN